MFSRKTRLRIRRVFKRQRRQALDIGATTEDNIDRYVFKRLMRLFEVKRFVAGWLGLITVVCIAIALQTQALSGFYTQVVPVAGGTFREGIVGEFTNANPLYAQTDVDASVSRLLFSGLFATDLDGKLVPDIAESYKVNSSETIYTIQLKENVRWHDGEILNAEDVLFTFKTIQNIEAQSFLNSSFRGVDVSSSGEYSVTFRLSNALSGFLYSLTTGIIPEHLLSEVEPISLRSSSFNNLAPVGSGPFVFEAVEANTVLEDNDNGVSMIKNQNYHLSPANLERFIIRTYIDENSLAEAFKSSEVDSMVGLKSLPEDIDEKEVQVFNIPLTGQVMVFFKSSNRILASEEVRKALVLGINKNEIFEKLPYPVLSVDSPLLRFHAGYNKAYSQPTDRKVQAARILDKEGWKKDPSDGIRKKSGKKLAFKLHSSKSSEFTIVTQELQRQWKDLGVEVEIIQSSDEELQSVVSGHTYDALLFGLLVGFDPDVYPFWHTSQGDIRSETRLNLSEYSSKQADEALEAARTRSDESNKAIKYRPFLAAWKADYPALSLYQPQFLYVTTPLLSGFEYSDMQSSVDRYITVTDWKVRNENQTVQ